MLELPKLWKQNLEGIILWIPVLLIVILILSGDTGLNIWTLINLPYPTRVDLPTYSRHWRHLIKATSRPECFAYKNWLYNSIKFHKLKFLIEVMLLRQPKEQILMASFKIELRRFFINFTHFWSQNTLCLKAATSFHLDFSYIDRYKEIRWYNVKSTGKIHFYTDESYAYGK